MKKYQVKFKSVEAKFKSTVKADNKFEALKKAILKNIHPNNLNEFKETMNDGEYPKTHKELIDSYKEQNLNISIKVKKKHKLSLSSKEALKAFVSKFNSNDNKRNINPDRPIYTSYEKCCIVYMLENENGSKKYKLAENGYQIENLNGKIQSYLNPIRFKDHKGYQQSLSVQRFSRFLQTSEVDYFLEKQNKELNNIYTLLKH